MLVALVIRQFNVLKLSNNCKFWRQARPLLSYGCEAWIIRRTDERRLISGEMRFLRRNAEYIRWDNKRNEHILTELQISQITEFICQYRKNLEGACWQLELWQDLKNDFKIPTIKEKKFRKTFENMEGFSFVTHVKGLNRPNTGKEDDDDDANATWGLNYPPKHAQLLPSWTGLGKTLTKELRATLVLLRSHCHIPIFSNFSLFKAIRTEPLVFLILRISMWCVWTQTFMPNYAMVNGNSIRSFILK
jgi:hypothetical protein